MPTNLPPVDFRRKRALLRRLPVIMAVLAVFAVILTAMLVWGHLF
jgi:hypothetical protein